MKLLKILSNDFICFYIIKFIILNHDLLILIFIFSPIIIVIMYYTNIIILVSSLIYYVSLFVCYNLFSNEIEIWRKNINKKLNNL